MSLRDDDVYLNSRPHLPAAPLFDAYHRAGHTTLGQISRATGIAQSTLSTTRARGTINAWWADHLLIQLGTHPLDVYGHDWIDHDWYRAGRIDVAFEELAGVAS